MDSSQYTNCVRASRKLKRYSTGIAIAAAIIAFPFGLIGFSIECKAYADNCWGASLLQSFQLYVLNVGVDSLKNQSAWVAAFTAPVATLSALMAVFSHTISTFWRRISLMKKPPAVVFLGGGKNATSIALQKYPKENCSFRNKQERVVFVDSSATPLIHEHLNRLGCKICDWHGNALSSEVLKSTNAINAGQIWVLTGDDRRNIEIAQNLLSLRESRNNENQMVMANVDDQELIRDVSFAVGEHASVRFFSIKKLASRYLFRHHAPKLPVQAETTSCKNAKRLHIAIIGSGNMVDAMVEQAIVHFVYSDDPRQCLRITLIGNSANERMAALNRRFPNVADYSSDTPMMALLPIVEFEALDCVPSRMKKTDWIACQKALFFDAVYVNDNVDLNTVAWTNRVAALREIDCPNKHLRIVACLSQASYEDAALSNVSENTLPHDVEIFRIYDCISTADSYPGESQDRDAMLINLAYDVYDVEVFEQMDLHAAKIRAKEKWNGSIMDESLQEMFRRSSRFAADHILIKLALLYPELSDSKPGAFYKFAHEKLAVDSWVSLSSQPPGELVERLMMLEHRRFVVERLVDGWLPIEPITGDDAQEVKKKVQANKALRLNDTLVPFDCLPDDQKLKDRLIIECIPKILELRKHWVES